MFTKISKFKNMCIYLLGLLLVATVVLPTNYEIAYANNADFSIRNGVLTNYVGLGGNVVIPGNVKEIGPNAFAGTNTINSVTIPSSVKKIGKEAFSGCTSMTRLTLNKGLTTIDEQAFHGCGNLLKVTLPSTLSTIGKGAFEGCVSLKQITIPKNVRHIPETAFQNCSCLKKISLPSNLHSIGAYAFQGCIRLTSAIIPGHVTSVADGAFDGCRELKDVKVPSSVNTYGTGIFNSCSTDLIIWGKKNSAAHKYADSYMITFHPAMSLSSTKLTVGVRQNKRLKLNNAVRNVKWRTNKKSVAVVSSGGTVTGHSKGTATITAISAGQTFTCKVTVK